MKKRLKGLAALLWCHRRRRVTLANVGEGTHEGALTKKTDAAIATRYLVVKQGSDADHVAVAGASDKPFGVCTDEASAAEERVAVELLGTSKRTILMVASEAIAANSEVYTAASGKVQDEPTGAGTYYVIGRARTASSADGDLIEVQPNVPIKVVVIATFGNTDNEIGGLTIGAGYTQAEVVALRDKCEELADDVRAIRTALSAPALLKIL